MDATTERALERVRKLLALATSPNENEAASAAAMAQRIMHEHALSQAMLATPDEDTPAIANDPLMVGARFSTWRLRLAMVVSRSNGCEPMFRNLALHGKVTQQRLFIAGRAPDVATVGYLYAYLVHAIDGLAAGRGDHSRAWLNAYRNGIVDTLAARLAAAQDAARAQARATTHDAVATERAIVRVDARTATARAVVEAFSPNARSRPVRDGGQDANGRHTGRADGQRIELGAGPGLAAPARTIGRGQ